MASLSNLRRIFQGLCLLTVLGFVCLSLCSLTTCSTYYSNSFVSSSLNKLIYKDPGTNVPNWQSRNTGQANGKVLELSYHNESGNGTSGKPPDHGNSLGRRTPADHQELTNNHNELANGTFGKSSMVDPKDHGNSVGRPASTNRQELTNNHNELANGTFGKPAKADPNDHVNSLGRRTSPDHQELTNDTDFSASDPWLSASNPMVRMMHKLEPGIQFGPTTKSKVVVATANTSTDSADQKIILFLTRYPSASWEWGFGLGHKPFIANNCPVSNCMTTNDTAMLKQASAIAIHPPYRMDSIILPRIRYPNQTYIIHLREAPARFKFSDHFDGVFNLTMAYRADSDIPVPYGIMTTGDSSWQGTSEELRKLITGKTKLVAWFVSNFRNVPSMREKYVQQLQRYIPVDIYGACGPLKCTKHEDCMNMLEHDYKFYLSFENSVCTEYITEKAYKVLQRYVVPVVYGGANYSLHTPPHSVINVRDFSSPKHLATYLKELTGDEQRYMEYFSWKKRYSLRQGIHAMAMCKICELLHDPTREKTVHTKLWNWWFNGTCSKPITVK